MVCVAIVRGGYAQLAATPLTHAADALELHETCREIEDAYLDTQVTNPDEVLPRCVSVLGVTLFASTLAELIEAAGMIVRTELLNPHPVRLGVFAGCALVVDDGESMFSLMGLASTSGETAKVFEQVTPIAAPKPKLGVVKGGAR